MKNDLCFTPADILLPKSDFERFSVIACDQFTSEPEYWESVRDYTDGYPTALDLILPEIYLEDDNAAKVEKINENMKKYLENGIFCEIENSFIFVRRVQSNGVLRLGLLGKIDLKEYSYLDDGKGAVRSTEKTVLERIPPRAEIRRGALLELPHAMLLFDDEEDKVMRSLESARDKFEKLYGFELFGGAGSIEGYRVTGEIADSVINALSDIKSENGGLLFCVGDGNHSLAAAKRIYEESGLERDRYALAEIVNIHSPAINFEPIYRVAFGVEPQKLLNEFVAYCGIKGGEYEHTFSLVCSAFEKTVTVRSDYRLPVAALSDFLDNEKSDIKIDYIHGVDSVKKIACQKSDRLGFVFEGMKKTELFEAVSKNGSLPRKTFSLGHALDKRFYLEARKIK
ncbi:MAG: DUF1015 domain-containing protein [Clostridia bacterium]|nr:DUF1015 domain-containing protein [Clostridia bacterium]